MIINYNESAPEHMKTPQNEINHLRNMIAEKHDVSKFMPREIKMEEHAKSAIADHREVDLNEILEGKNIYLKNVEAMMSSLGSKETDAQVVELAGIMLDKGVRVAMDIAEKMKKPELEDDFHRFLIKYLLSGHEDEERNIPHREWKALHMKLFEIVPPPSDDESDKKDPKVVITMMEQLYAAMQMVASDTENKDDAYYSLEISIANGSNEVVFYIAAPVHIENILEKTLQSYFPGIQVIPHDQDYNIFHDSGYQIGATVVDTENNILPIKTYKEIEGDPITVIMSAFTKLKKHGEGAAFQILVKPAGEKFKREYGDILNNIRRGDSFKDAIKRESLFGGFLLDVKESFKDKEEIEKEKNKTKENYKEDEYIKQVTKKIESTIVNTNMRLFSSAETLDRAKAIMIDMQATFRQYTEINGNSIKFINHENRDIGESLHNFIYRLWDEDESTPLNLSELATLYHIPGYLKDFAQVKSAKNTTAPAPLDLPQEGVILGKNIFRHITTDIHMSREDRMRHLYVIGQTGTGKTTILKNMIVQDILNGDGCCFIDPHGSDIDDILSCVPPERYDDVIYFDPAYAARPMGLNMLEYDIEKPEQKTFVINEMLSIFNKLFDMKAQGGAGFEAMFRNVTQLVMEHPSSGNTLLEISRTLSDKDFRDYKLSKCKNPMIHQYWKNAEATSGEQGLQNWVPYINSKIDPFLTNDIMRPVVAQEKSSFNIREIMDNKKIFLVNLSKGRLGEQNAYLIGLILVGKFLQAALSRVDAKDRPDFYLYIDEFQNVTTPSIASILSEARKYRLSLNIAHQYIAQLPEDIKSAVFGNVGSMAIYRVSTDDAKYLESQFAPTFTASDIMKIDNYHCYVKLLSHGTPQKPFSMSANPSPVGNPSIVAHLKEMSYQKYGRDRAEVEGEIMSKYGA